MMVAWLLVYGAMEPQGYRASPISATFVRSTLDRLFNQSTSIATTTSGIVQLQERDQVHSLSNFRGLLQNRSS